MAGRRTALSVDLGAGLLLPTPVVVASGCFGRELGNFVDLRKLGGIVTRSLTVQPRPGSPTPRMAETPSGLLSETGLQNEGLEAFREKELPFLQRIGVPLLVSIAGNTVEDLVKYMTDQGLRFTAATQGDETAYQSLYQDLLNYDTALGQRLTRAEMTATSRRQ